MIFALIGETWRNHQEDMARYHDQMADFYREKRREKRRTLLNECFGSNARKRGRYSAAGTKKTPLRIGRMHRERQAIRTYIV